LRYFADTWFWVALLNKRESGHQTAHKLKKKVGDDIVTSQLVMIEFMAHCSKLGPYLRSICCELVKDLDAGPVQVVPHSDELYARAFETYEKVKDKEWSLVDCASFEIMKDNSVTLALTEDHHFTQAGFIIAEP
jgi:uncharacterized protein